MKSRVEMTLMMLVFPMIAAGSALATSAAAIDPSSVVDIATTPSGHGYWLMNAAGHVFSFGDAPDFGDLPAEEGTYSAMVAATNGKGLWAVTLGPAGVGGHLNTLGSVASFGDFASTGDPTGGGSCCASLVGLTKGL